MKNHLREFLVVDVDVVIQVWEVSRKEIFANLEDYIDYLNYLPEDQLDDGDDSFAILYRDGSEDYITWDYDGHRIKKYNIHSMVYSNPEDYLVYGPFAINEYGVVTTSEYEDIDDTNIVEITVD